MPIPNISGNVNAIERLYNGAYNQIGSDPAEGSSIPRLAIWIPEYDWGTNLPVYLSNNFSG